RTRHRLYEFAPARPPGRNGCVLRFVLQAWAEELGRPASCRMTRVNGSGVAARALDVWKVYGTTEDTRVEALAGVTVDFLRGHFTAIMGPSGSGKSTLMHCLAGLDTVTRGEVWIGGTPVSTLGDRGLTRLRRDQVGFVFQQFNLMPTLTAEENITLPLAIGGRRPDR